MPRPIKPSAARQLALPLALCCSILLAACGSGSTSTALDDAGQTDDDSAVPEQTASTAPLSEQPDGCPATDGTETQKQAFALPQPMCIDTETVYYADFVTNHGEFKVELDPAKAPETVNNFVTLARFKYFDNTLCHRIITDFVVQCGDPDATGRGGPGYQFADELPAKGAYELGSFAMANSGPDTNGSQFFIISGSDGVALPPAYSLFGQVIEGFDSTITTLNSFGLDGGTPTEEVQIQSVTITEG